MSVVDYLSDLPLFAGIDLSIVSKYASVETHCFDSVLYYEGDLNSKIYFLVSGSAKAYKFCGDKEVFLYDVTPGSPISDYSSVSYSSVSFTADSVVISFSMSDFKEFVLPLVALKFIDVLSTRNALFDSVVNGSVVHSAIQKVSILLYDDLIKFNSYDRKHIAYILNMSAETLSRVLSRLQKSSIIEVASHKVSVLSSVKLGELFL